MQSESMSGSRHREQDVVSNRKKAAPIVSYEQLLGAKLQKREVGLTEVRFELLGSTSDNTLRPWFAPDLTTFSRSPVFAVEVFLLLRQIDTKH
jgi:hypothetical protein